MNKFFTSDLHLGHKFVARTRGFADVRKHDEHIADCWNTMVGKDDKVYVVGDVFWNASGMEQELNGQLTLIMGNHDTYRAQRYLDKGFKLKGCLEMNGHILTHIPVHPMQFDRYRGNIHGHLHTRLVMDGGEPDERYVNVCLEQANLCPIPYEEIAWVPEQEAEEAVHVVHG